MQFTTKLACLVFACISSAVPIAAGVAPRKELVELSVVFYDDVGETGASFSPDGLLQGVCTTLPGAWLDRAESVKINTGYACTFYQLQGCAGTGITLSGTVGELPMDTLYNNIESFFCNKAVV